MKVNRYKSVALLTAFSFLGKIVGAFYKIVLIAIVGAVGIGYYQLAFPVFVFLFTFVSSGMSTSLTVMIAENKIDKNKSYSIFRYANKVVLFWSVVSGIVLVIIAPYLARFQGNKIITPIYYVVAVASLGVNILNNFKAYLRGRENTGSYIVADTIEQIAKFIFSVLFALLLINQGVIIACIGIFAGIGLSCFVTIFYLYIFVFAKECKNVSIIKLDKQEKSKLINFTLLAMITTLILPAVQFIDSVIIVNLLQRAGESSIGATILFGLSKGTVSALLNIVNCILIPIEFLFLPNLVELSCCQQQKESSRKVIDIVLMVTVPIASGFFFFSNEVITLLYSRTFTAEEILVAGKLLKIGSLGLIFSSVASMQNIIFQGIRKLQYSIYSLLVASVSKLVFEVFLIGRLSIYATELSGILFYLVLALFNFIFLYKEKFEVSSPIKIPIIGVGILFGVVARLLYSFWSAGVYSALKFVVSVVIVFISFVLVIGGIGFLYKTKEGKRKKAQI